MPASASSSRRPLRDLLTIGQTWQHRDPDFSIEVKQVHRADRLLEAWVPTPTGPAARILSFADLSRDYELVC